MPHRQYDKEAIHRAQERVEYCQKMIDNAKLVKIGDKDAIKNALETVREMEFTARFNMIAFLKRSTDQADGLAKINLGEMQAYQSVLTLFESPDEFIKHYEQDKIADEQFLKESKLYQEVNGGESQQS